jgi:Putative DNA-binding domain
MELQDLKRLVRQGEGLHLEFKLKSNHPEKIVREVVAFANTEGGLLMIGVSDDLHLVGLKFPDEDEYLLQKAIEKYCFPKIEYKTHRVRMDDGEKEILLFYIPKSKNVPHHVLLENEQKIYIRIADKCIQASKEMREILKEIKKEKQFKFNYGDKEQTLMRYLAQHQNITVLKFSKIAQIPEKIASRTLVLLVLANVLRIMPNDHEDCFQTVQETENSQILPSLSFQISSLDYFLQYFRPREEETILKFKRD